VVSLFFDFGKHDKARLASYFTVFISLRLTFTQRQHFKKKHRKRTEIFTETLIFLALSDLKKNHFLGACGNNA
jgi:hypothetical protein